MVVFKYAIENRPGYQRVDIPKSAKIFRVRLSQSNNMRLYLWAFVQQEPVASLAAGEPVTPGWGTRTTRTFSVEMTGVDKPWIKPENHIGTYDDGPHVLHIFEVS